MPAMSKIANTAAVLAAALISQAAAHTYVKEFQAGGKTYAGFYAADKSGGDDSSPAWRTNQGWGFQPVFGDKINTPDIIAHIDGEPSPFTAPVDAGSDVKFTWQHDGDCGGEEVGWDCSHHGWTATYLAPCNGDCANVKKEDLSFFKIHQAGLLDYREGRYSEGGERENTGYWGTDAIFYDGGNSQTVTIPKELPSGNYVLRTEVASIHNNGDVSQRQFWPQALNIAIQNGNDNAQMPAGVKATEIYSSSDELLTWDLYQHEAGKTIPDAPGPALAPCAAGSGSTGSGSSPSSSAAPAAPSAAPSAAAEAEASTPTSEAANVTATQTQVAYVTATASASAVSTPPSAPAATPTPEAPEQGEEGDDEDDEEGEYDGEEEEEEEGEEDDEEEEGDGEEDDDEEEEGDDQYQGWGEGREHWRSHPREFTA
ncbi:hypothetical protein N0V90_010754 [Kalmusia sp. IMI 367209]|nr:hypothetical protein N0V90_010754 [Kalmusia sp. IMI 367209]